MRSHRLRIVHHASARASLNLSRWKRCSRSETHFLSAGWQARSEAPSPRLWSSVRSTSSCRPWTTGRLLRSFFSCEFCQHPVPCVFFRYIVSVPQKEPLRLHKATAWRELMQPLWSSKVHLPQRRFTQTHAVACALISSSNQHWSPSSFAFRSGELDLMLPCENTEYCRKNLR